LIRFGALPLNYLDRFIALSSLDFILYRKRFYSAIERASTMLQTELYEVIPTLQDKEHRQKLLNLKRTIMKLHPLDNEQLRVLIDSGIAESRVRRYNTLIEHKLVKLEVLANNAAIRDSTRVTTALKELGSATSVQNAILMSSDTVSEMLNDYLVDNPFSQKSTRQMEMTLMRYIIRAMTKTSPFSTFTHVGEISWTLGHNLPNLPSTRADTYINPKLGWSVLNMVVGNSDDRDRYVRLNPNVTVKGNELRVYSQRLTWTSSTSAMQDQFAILRVSEDIYNVLNVFRDSPRINLNNLVTRLSERTSNAGKLVRELLKVGVLIDEHSMDEHSFDTILQLIKNSKFNQYLNIKDNIETLKNLSKEYGESEDFSHRRIILQETKRVATDMYIHDELKDKIPVPIILENSYTRSPVQIDPTNMDKIYLELCRFARVCGVFDPLLGIRETQTAFFLKQNTRSMDLVEFYKAWNQFVKDEETEYTIKQASPENRKRHRLLKYNPLQLDSISVNHKIHSEVLRLIRDNLDHEEVDIEGAFRNQPVTHNMSNIAILGQVHAVKGDPKYFIVNQATDGYGSMFGRFAPQLSDELTRKIRDNNARGADNEHIADINGFFGYVGDFRPRFTRQVIVYPGSQLASDATNLLVSDLRVIYDPKSKSIKLLQKSTGHIVIPKYLGSLLTYYLPPFARFLAHLSSVGSLSNPLHLFIPNLLEDFPEKIIKLPRIKFGNHLALARRAWIVPSKLIPPRLPHVSYLDYMDTLLHWFAANRIPHRFFLKIDDSFRLSSTEKVRNVDRKPKYIDLRTYYLIRDLERAIRLSPTYLYLEEVDPDQYSTLSLFNASYAIEFAFEVIPPEED